MITSLVYRFKYYKLLLFSKWHSSKFIGIDDYPNKILFVCNAGVGDLIMSLPTIFSIIKYYPKSKYKLFFKRKITYEASKIIFQNKKIEYNIDNINDIDLIVYLFGTINSNLSLLKKFKSSKFIGFISDNKIRSNFIETPKIKYDFNNHVLSNYKIYNILSSSKSNPKYPIINSNNTKKIIEESDYIVINPKTKGFVRNWPKDNYVKLIKLINSKFKKYKFVLIGGNDDKETSTYIQNKINNDIIINLTGDLNFTDSYDVILNARALITGDSGIMHLGFLSKTNTIALFGPTNPQNYLINYDNKKIICLNTKFCKYGVASRKCNCSQNDACDFLKNIDEHMVFENLSQDL